MDCCEVEGVAIVPSDDCIVMNKEQQHLPSCFRENFNLKKCLFVTTNSNNFQSFLVNPEFSVAKHQTNKFCNKKKQCKHHIMLYGFDKIQNKLMHLKYDFGNVNCPYSYFKFFIILSEKVVCIRGNFLMEPLLLVTRHNRIHRSKECVTSLLWRRLGRKKRRRHSPATTNRGPQHTRASLMNIVQMQIVVATRLLEMLQQHSSSEISTISTNDISTITE